MKVGFLGLGLIGGSIARALKQHQDKYEVLVYDLPEVLSSNYVKDAVAEHVIDTICTDVVTDFCDCDLILLCAPVLINVSYLKQLSGNIKKSCIISDVGSVKASIHEAAKECKIESQFIGGHPMAGSEKNGFENSSKHLLENAYYILTPTPSTKKECMERMKNIITDINAIPMVLGVKEHDDITAAISHVPHIIASELVNLVKNCDDETEKMRMLAAGGFKDITRIASSSPAMWQSICLSNPESIKKVLNQFIDSLQLVVNAITDNKEQFLYQMFEEALEYRSKIPNSKGSIYRIYELYIDITDEPGAIAIIATLLGSNSISIKNIGIIHNREFEEGVLKIELYKEEELKKASKLLISHNYSIYERH